MIKLLAILGGILFSIGVYPTAIKTIRNGKSIGTPVSTAYLIIFGCLCLYFYTLLQYGFDAFLFITYFLEIIGWGIIVVYHYKK